MLFGGSFLNNKYWNGLFVKLTSIFNMGRFSWVCRPRDWCRKLWIVEK